MKIPKWLKPKNDKDALHYLLVFSTLSFAWLFGMSIATGRVIDWRSVFTLQIGAIWTFSLAIFYIADKLAHHLLKVD
jgi:hypothetical protein